MNTRSTRIVIALAVFLGVSCVASAAEQWVAGTLDGNVFRLTDYNSDGDALDIGENILWATGMSDVTDLTSSPNGVFATNNATGSVTRLSDANGDGDALDIGESMLWADGMFGAMGIARGKGSVMYVTQQSILASVWRLDDINGDGDALDIGERLLYARVPDETGLVSRCGDILVSSYIEGRVYRLVDSNGDEDALDIGEALPYTPAIIGGPIGLLPAAGGVVFAAGNGDDTIYRIDDANGDGDALDIGETLVYADIPSGGLNGPTFMAPTNSGGFLLTEHYDSEVSLVRDVNSDGDALDIGEVMLFANMIEPTGIDRMPRQTGDVNYDGTIGSTDYDTLLKQFGRTGCRLEADLNEDGIVDIRDFQILRASYTPGGSPAPAYGPTPAPEPATMLILCSSAAPILLKRRRRN